MIEKPVRCEKVIQFGEGGFLRGFVDWIIQITNEKNGYREISIFKDGIVL